MRKCCKFTLYMPWRFDFDPRTWFRGAPHRDGHLPLHDHVVGEDRRHGDVGKGGASEQGTCERGEYERCGCLHHPIIAAAEEAR